MNLYELKGAYQQIQELIYAGEDYVSVLETLSDAIECKADSYAKVLRNIDGNIEAIDYELTRLTDKKRSLENASKRLKTNLYECMKETGKEQFKTDLFSFNIVKNGGKAPLIMKATEDQLPDELVTITRKANNDAIRDYIEKTGDVTYAELGERGESLRIR